MISSKELAEFLNAQHIGKEVQIFFPGGMDDNRKGVLKFVSNFDLSKVKILNRNQYSFIIVEKEYSELLDIPHMISSNPRLDFCKANLKYFDKKVISKIEPTAHLSKSAKLGEGVYVGFNSVIGKNVSIGARTQIMHNCVISDNVKIGSDCLIKSGSVVGEKGFGFERDENEVPIVFTHYGSVIIGNNVEIGALNTVARGVLTDTFIGDNVKTDDHIHIAHNVIIEKNCLIVCGAIICGSVKIREGSWVGPNSSIIDQAELGKKCFVGIGTNVTKSFESNSKIVGNPARKI